jgi:hypothetical protein
MNKEIKTIRLGRREIAVKVLGRFLRVFKYRQAHALLREPTVEDLGTAFWLNESGLRINLTFRAMIRIPATE